MVAAGSTMASLSAFSVTLSLSRDTTATTENNAPFGFQHLVQPQAWLCAHCAPIVTLTGFWAHLHMSVPPAKLVDPALTPPSTHGWIEIVVAMDVSPFLVDRRDRQEPSHLTRASSGYGIALRAEDQWRGADPATPAPSARAPAGGQWAARGQRGRRGRAWFRPGIRHSRSPLRSPRRSPPSGNSSRHWAAWRPVSAGAAAPGGGERRPRSLGGVAGWRG